MNPEIETTPQMEHDKITEAELLQEDCHRFIKTLQDYNPKLTYEAAKATWLYNKLAEIEISIRQINDKLNVQHRN